MVRRLPKVTELLMGPTAFATWDEAELLEVPMTSKARYYLDWALGL
jgi:hypothetical protein